MYYNADDELCEKNCQTFIREQNMNEDFEHYYNFSLAHECGTSLHELGVKVARIFEDFTAGEQNFFLDKISHK